MTDDSGIRMCIFHAFLGFWYFSWVSLAKFIIEKTEKAFSLKGCAINNKFIKLLLTNDTAFQKINKIISLLDAFEMFRPANKIATKVTDLELGGCP